MSIQDLHFAADPAFGGNKIKAPAPIGGARSGTYEDASSAFGVATSLTVSQILAYAASQSNAGGSVWYGNVKARQEPAKDTIDAINNEVAFSP